MARPCGNTLHPLGDSADLDRCCATIEVAQGRDLTGKLRPYQTAGDCLAETSFDCGCRLRSPQRGRADYSRNRDRDWGPVILEHHKRGANLMQPAQRGDGYEAFGADHYHARDGTGRAAELQFGSTVLGDQMVLRDSERSSRTRTKRQHAILDDSVKGIGGLQLKSLPHLAFRQRTLRTAGAPGTRPGAD